MRTIEHTDTVADLADAVADLLAVLNPGLDDRHWSLEPGLPSVGGFRATAFVDIRLSGLPHVVALATVARVRADGDTLAAALSLLVDRLADIVTASGGVR